MSSNTLSITRLAPVPAAATIHCYLIRRSAVRCGWPAAALCAPRSKWQNIARPQTPTVPPHSSLLRRLSLMQICSPEPIRRSRISHRYHCKNSGAGVDNRVAWLGVHGDTITGTHSAWGGCTIWAKTN